MPQERLPRLGEGAAAAVGRDAKYRATPRVTARRIKTAEAELRKTEKHLKGYTTRHLGPDGKTPLSMCSTTSPPKANGGNSSSPAKPS